MTSPYHVNGFFCETVIFDQESRQSLIGIFPTRVQFPAFPAPMTLGVFIRITPLPPTGTPIQVQVRQDETTIFGFDTQAAATATEGDPIMPALHIALSRLMLNIEKPSTIDALVKIDGDDEWHRAMAMQLVQADTSAATQVPSAGSDIRSLQDLLGNS